jgi:hypothetical protein
MSLSEVLSSACSTLEAAADVLDVKIPSGPSTELPERKHILIALDRIKNDAAKGTARYTRRCPHSLKLRVAAIAVGVLCSADEAPSQTAAFAIVESMQQSVLSYCMLCHPCTATAGPTLQADLHKQVANIVDTCVSLLKRLVYLRSFFESCVAPD